MSKEPIKLKILDAAGRTLLTAPAAERVSLVYNSTYQPGDRVALEIGTPGQYCVVQFEDTMPEAVVFVQKREINFAVPLGEQSVTYSPKSFVGDCHIVRTRLASEQEIAARRNLAFNPYDAHGDTGFYPHAAANVETRGEAVFAARNAIDGVYENDAHGTWPYQSWGINRDPNAALTVSFGRPVVVDEIRLTLRADFPHDSWWTEATVRFDDGSSEILSLLKTAEQQAFAIPPRTVTALTLCELKKADDPSPFPALTQIEAWGTETNDMTFYKPKHHFCINQ